MSIQAMQLQGAERTAQMVRQSSSVAATSSSVAAGRRTQDQVELSDQGRQLAASLGEPSVELQLSPAKLREMATPPSE